MDSGESYMKIRLWGKAVGSNRLTPASFATSIENPDLFIRCLNDCEHGWILCDHFSDPNRMTKEGLVEMAKEILNHNGVQLLLVSQDKQGNRIWLSQNFAQYTERIMQIDWNKIGYVSAQPPKKEPETKARKALEELKQQQESNKTIPPLVEKLANQYNGKEKIPAPLLKKIEEWYTVSVENGVYSINPVE